MDTRDQPHHGPDSTKRFQVTVLEQTGNVSFDLSDAIDHTGVTMPLVSALDVAKDIEDEVVR